MKYQNIREILDKSTIQKDSTACYQQNSEKLRPLFLKFFNHGLVSFDFSEVSTSRFVL